MQDERHIAIIGIAGRFPDAANLEELRSNLLGKKCSLREISPERIRQTTLLPDGNYWVRGYLEDIDLFDYKHFNIPFSEAQLMDPHQRLLLEVAHETIENAGYSTDALSGSNTAVYVTYKELEYYRHADEFNPLLVTGNNAEFLAARINRVFNLTGAATVIDTSCSSSLVALHNACNSLILGDCAQALVCGASLELFPLREGVNSIEVESPDGRSVPFSDRSNGMAHGEAVVAVLLKPLAAARRDGDHVHAVITGTAINNNANRSASLNAPDSVTQAEVMRAAWQKAGISPLEIGFIETHGSGTRLGDNIEVGGLNLALKPYTDQTGIIPVSTIKANIGHTRCVAGLAGLAKAVLSLKHQEIYPAYYTGTPSPLIDFSRSPVYVNEERQAWPARDGKRRYAAVSSLGFSGTNSHVVLAEAPAPDRTESAGEPQLITVSARTAEGLQAALTALAARLETLPDGSLPDVSYTLARGRKHYPWRLAFVEASTGRLRQALRDAATTGSGPARPVSRLILVFADAPAVSEEQVISWAAQYPAFGQAVQDCIRAAGGDGERPHFWPFAFQFACAKLLASWGIAPKDVVGVGVGRIVAGVVAGQQSLAEGMQLLARHESAPLADVERRVDALVQREAAHGLVAFAGVVPSALTAALRRHPGNGKGYLVYENDPAAAHPLHLLQLLYLHQYDLDWEKLFRGHPGRRMELPAYRFSPTRCWIRETPKAQPAASATEVHPAAPDAPVDVPLTALQRTVAQHWKEALGVESVAAGDDFFSRGGDSLMATKVIQRLRQDLRVALAFEDLFDYPVLAGFCGLVESMLDTEGRLYLLWQEVLKQPGLNPEDDFFAIGGHSLLANQILNRIGKQVGVALDFEDFFAYPTIRSMAAHVDSLLEKQRKADGSKIKKAPSQPHYDLSNAQRRLWILSQLEGGSVAYNECPAYTLRGDVDRAILEKCFQTIVARHESLRTAFITADGEPRQQILSPAEYGFRLECLDVSGEPHPAGRAHAVADAYGNAPFDLQHGRLFQAMLLRTEPAAFVLLLKVHHIVFDEWSFGVMLKELFALYAAYAAGKPSPLAPLPLHYKDYTAWQNDEFRGEAFARHRAYWFGQFSGEVPVLALPTDWPRPARKSFGGSSITGAMPAGRLEALRRLSRQQGASTFMTLLALLKALLYRYSGQDDIVLGVPVAGRERLELEDQIGFYANTLPLRTQFDGELPFTALLERVRHNVIRAYEHQAYPFDMLAEALDLRADLSRSPLFDVLVVYKRDEAADNHDTFAGIAISSFNETIDKSKFDLNVQFVESARGLEITIVYNTDLYRAETARRFLGHFLELAAAVDRQPDAPLAGIDYLPEAEKRQLTAGFCHGAPEPARTAGLHELFEACVARTPEAVALVSEGAALTYREVNAQANRLADHLAGPMGLRAGDRVGILMDKSFEMAVSMLGILKAGCVYVPLQPFFPDERINGLIAAARVKVLLVDHLAFAGKYGLTECLPLGVKELLQGPAAGAPGRVRAGYPAGPGASILYTSGSTGTPKGVLIEHEGVVSRLHWRWAAAGTGGAEVGLMRTNFVFDVSMMEIFSVLCGGGQLVVCTDEVLADPLRTLEALARFGVTSLYATPTEYNLLLDAIDPVRAPWPSSLQHVLCAGETLPKTLAEKHYGRTGATLWNTYGPTEASIIVSYHVVGAGDQNVPIGKPLPGVQLHVLDPHLRLVPVGVWGEICISGTGLAKGYLSQEHTRAGNFTDNPYADGAATALLYRTGDTGRWQADGNLEFRGRTDDQLKLNGYRVELAEVEHAICKDDRVKEAAVVARRQDAEAQLVAFLVRHPAEDDQPAPAAGGAAPPRTAELLPSPGVTEADLRDLDRFNQTDHPFPGDRVFHEIFAERVAETPDAIAAVCAGRHITYRDLDAKAEALARVLLAHGLTREMIVPLLADRSIELLTGLLATFKAGGCYLPVSPGLPAGRVREMLRECDARLLLTTSAAWAGKGAELTAGG